MSIGCLNSKVDFFNFINFGNMCFQFFVDVVMVFFFKQLKVEFCEFCRVKSVGVMDNLFVFFFFDFKLIVGQFWGVDDIFKKMRVMD